MYMYMYFTGNLSTNRSHKHILTICNIWQQIVPGGKELCFKFPILDEEEHEELRASTCIN